MLSEREFYDYVRQHILEYVRDAEGKEARVQKICRNNQVMIAALSIGREGEHLQPVLYLEPYYQEYAKGWDLSEIMCGIGTAYEECSLGFDLDEQKMTDYGYIKDRLFYRLVHYGKNREMLKMCPFDQMEDLAVTYRWMAYRNADGMASALVRKRDLLMWGVDEEQIKKDARRNTEKIFPPVLKKIESVIPVQVEESGIPVFVLSNSDYMNGASAMIYQEVLYDFASRMEQNLYILPSSIHEVILLREADVENVRELSYMVKETNQTIVNPEEILSDHVYYYDRRSDRIRIADHPGWTGMS